MPFNREKLVATARRKRGRLQPSSRAERDFSRRGAVLRPSGARPAPTEPAGETNPNGEAAFCAEKCGEPQGFAATWSGRRESNPRIQLGKLMFYH